MKQLLYQQIWVLFSDSFQIVPKIVKKNAKKPLFINQIRQIWGHQNTFFERILLFQSHHVILKA